MREPAQRDRVVLLGEPIRWVSASRRCSTGSASTPLTITTACSSETWPAAIASLTGSWSQSSACATAGGASRRVWSAGSVLAHRRRCRWRRGSRRGRGGRPGGRPGARARPAGAATRPPRRGCRPVGVADRPQPRVAELVEVGVEPRHQGRDRVRLWFAEYRCHTGNSGIRHRQSWPITGVLPGMWTSIFVVSGAVDVVVSTSSTSGKLDQRWVGHRRGQTTACATREWTASPRRARGDRSDSGLEIRDVGVTPRRDQPW